MNSSRRTITAASGLLALAVELTYDHCWLRQAASCTKDTVMLVKSQFQRAMWGAFGEAAVAAAINPNKTLTQREQETRARNDRTIFQRIAERQAAERKRRDEHAVTKRP